MIQAKGESPWSDGIFCAGCLPAPGLSGSAKGPGKHAAGAWATEAGAARELMVAPAEVQAGLGAMA